jgi:hypothetical protein
LELFGPKCVSRDGRKIQQKLFPHASEKMGRVEVLAHGHPARFRASAIPKKQIIAD